jgi:hypothetical protein
MIDSLLAKPDRARETQILERLGRQPGKLRNSRLYDSNEFCPLRRGDARSG